jgi:hypothetical protein
MVRVFVSSTSKDLVAHRESVIKMLQETNHLLLVMETFHSRDGDAVDVSLSSVRQADVFVGIYARRYGYRPNNGKTSVTEMEYGEAKKNDIPCLLFLVDADYDDENLSKHAETDNRGKMLLEMFIERINEDNVRSIFTTPEDLAKKVLYSLHNWVQENLQELQTKQQNTSSTTIQQTINGDNHGQIIGNINDATFNMSGRKKRKKHSKDNR